MPRSKKNIKVDLAKTRQHGLEGKKGLVREIQDCCDKYEHLFIFSVNDMRNSKMKDVRQQWKHSRFFIGKNKVMTIALGRTPEEAYKPNLQKVSKRIAGQKGLLFSNKPVHEVIQWFNSYTDEDFARSGNVATESVTLPEGPLAQFPHSMESYLRQLGLPTTLKKGVIHLLNDYFVCNEGDVLSPDTAKILKLLGYQMAEFHLKIECVWSKDGTFEDFGSEGKENGDEPPKKKRRVESMEISSATMADEVEESTKMPDEVEESTKMADEVEDEEDMMVDEDQDDVPQLVEDEGDVPQLVEDEGDVPQLVEDAASKVKKSEDKPEKESVKLESNIEEVTNEAEPKITEQKNKDESKEGKSVKDKEVEVKAVKDKEVEVKAVKDKEVEVKAVKDKEVEDKAVEGKEVDKDARTCEVSTVDIEDEVKDEDMKEVSDKEEKVIESTVSPKKKEDSKVTTQDEVEEIVELDSEKQVTEEKDIDKESILKMTQEKIEAETTESTKKFSPKLTRSRAKASNQKVVTPDERLLRSARKSTKRKA